MGGRDRKSPGAYGAGGLAYVVTTVSSKVEGGNRDPYVSCGEHMYPHSHAQLWLNANLKEKLPTTAVALLPYFQNPINLSIYLILLVLGFFCMYNMRVLIIYVVMISFLRL